MRSTLENPSAQWPPIDPEGWARTRNYNAKNLTESIDRFVRGIAEICRGFGVKTVAEGVETPEILTILRELGVDRAQGYHIGYIASEALKRGAVRIEPSQAAQDAYIAQLRSRAIDNSTYVNECTPSYFNNEGDQVKKRSIFGEPYNSYYDFEAMLGQWRDAGKLEGLVLTREAELEPAE